MSLVGIKLQNPKLKVMKKVNVIHLTTFNGLTGAGISTKRLNEALNSSSNINSSIISLYDEKNKLANRFSLYKLRKRMYNFLDRILFIKRNKGIHFSSGLGGVKLKKLNKELDTSDFIHIHWVQNNFISIHGLSELINRFEGKVIIHIHDTWLLTGGCHINFKCEGFKNSCSDCPHLNSGKFVVKKLLSYKSKKIKPIDCVLIVPSQSYLKLINESYLRHFNTLQIANTLNAEIFESSKSVLKKKNPSIKYVLFGALDIKNKYKGYLDFIESIKILLNNKLQIEVVFFGEGNPADVDLDCPIHFLGKFSDEKDLAMVYSSVDVYVSTSYQESFGQTIIESIACGTPVVCYDNSSPSEIVLHKKNGYISNFKDIKDVARGMFYCITDLKKDELNFNFYIDNKYGYGNISKRYIELYKNNRYKHNT